LGNGYSDLSKISEVYTSVYVRAVTIVKLLLQYGSSRCSTRIKGLPGGDKCTGPHEYSDHHDRRSNGFYPGDPDRARLNPLFGGINEGEEDSLEGKSDISAR
jgi:hypothetical protein